jgi:hypothetical protein
MRLAPLLFPLPLPFMLLCLGATSSVPPKPLLIHARATAITATRGFVSKRCAAGIPVERLFGFSVKNNKGRMHTDKQHLKTDAAVVASGPPRTRIIKNAFSPVLLGHYVE